MATIKAKTPVNTTATTTATKNRRIEDFEMKFDSLTEVLCLRAYPKIILL
jgi:hypothetical protein